MERIIKKPDGTAYVLYQGGTFSNFTETGTFMVEREFMLSKALIFADPVAAEKIRQAKTGKECRALGRSVRNFDKALWDKVSVPIMLMLQYHRWTEPGEFEFMKSISSSLDLPKFAECAPWDGKWGTGKSLEDSINGWTGENLMGKILSRTAALISKAKDADEISVLNRLWPEYRMILEKQGRMAISDYPPSKLVKKAEDEFLGRTHGVTPRHILENPAELLEDRAGRLRFRFSVFGSRNGGMRNGIKIPIPSEAEKRISATVRAFCAIGGWVRSGGAEGVDSMAEAAANGRITIFRPHQDKIVAGGNRVEALSSPLSRASVEFLHPNPGILKPYAVGLHERNFNILFGQRGMENSSLFAICWTPGGQETGGSGQTMRCARITNSDASGCIPVFNVALDDDLEKLRNLFREMKEAIAGGKEFSIRTLSSLKMKLEEMKDYFILDVEKPELRRRMLDSSGKWTETPLGRKENSTSRMSKGGSGISKENYR